jgi:hypothetical protein
MARTEVSGSQIKDGSVALSGAASPTGNADVAGVLPAGNGGTGLSSPGASGNVLTSDGTGWTTAAPTGGGGSSRVVSTVTSAVTLGSTAGTQYVASIGSGGSVTLPTAVGNTSLYTLKNNDTTAKTIATVGDDASFGSVIALIQGNGDNNSTVFTDSAAKYTWAANAAGSAKLSTAVKKFGTASIYFGAGGNNACVGPPTSFPGMGTSDFTIEMWFYSTVAAPQYGYYFYDNRPYSVNGVYTTLYVGGSYDGANAQKLVFMVSATARIVGTTTITTNTWHHVALSRSAGVTRLFLNGVQEGSSYTDTNNYLTSQAWVGNTGAFVNGVWAGYVDDIRITQGVGRYTTNFTAPTAEFTTSQLVDGTYPLVLAPNQAVELTSSGSNWSVVSDAAALPTFTTTPTFAGTTTLTLASTQVQEFTGTTTHTVKLPTTGIVAGRQFTTINSSTGLVTVQSSSAASIIVLVAASSATFTALVSTPTTAAHWRVDYSPFTSSGSSFALARTGDAFLSVDSGGAKVILGSTGTDAFVGTQSAHSINVRTGNTTRATIDTSGNLSVTGSITAATVPVVTTTGTQTLSNKVINESTVAVGTVGATVTLGLTGTIQTATLTSATACTVTMPAVASGASFVLYLRQPATGTPTTATFSSVRWGTNGAPVITAVLGRMDILTFFSDGAYWYGQAAQGYQY